MALSSFELKTANTTTDDLAGSRPAAHLELQTRLTDPLLPSLSEIRRDCGPRRVKSSGTICIFLHIFLNCYYPYKHLTLPISNCLYVYIFYFPKSNFQSFVACVCVSIFLFVDARARRGRGPRAVILVTKHNGFPLVL